MGETNDQAAWVIRCDGSAVPNPGRMGLGAVLVAPGGCSRHTLSQATGTVGCNNEAELRALLLALQWLAQHRAPATALTVAVFSDSRVLVDQLGGPGDATPVVRLAPLVDALRAQMRTFGAVAVHWVPRHRNAEADTLARAALGLAAKPASPHRQGRRKR